MPLHDWGDLRGWSGVHTSWLVEIVRAIRPQLPPGFRTYIGTSPLVAIDDPPGEPDVAVRRANGNGSAPSDGADPFRPDREVLIATIAPNHVAFVEQAGRLVAAVELVSPVNKDRPSRRAETTGRYLSYLMNGAHLLLVDLHPYPLGLSLADRLASRLEIPDEPPLPPPFAISYRVGEPDRVMGSYVAMRREQLEPGRPLPPMPLALNDRQAVTIDLEGTYMRAAADAYLT